MFLYQGGKKSSSCDFQEHTRPIIKGGENISPRELDEILYSHASVIEAAVFGRKDRHYGQVVEACVVIEKNAKISEAELIDLCLQQAGKFKSPEKIHFVQELPKGPSGKIQRLKLESSYFTLNSLPITKIYKFYLIFEKKI